MRVCVLSPALLKYLDLNRMPAFCLVCGILHSNATHSITYHKYTCPYIAPLCVDNINIRGSQGFILTPDVGYIAGSVCPLHYA